MHSVVANFGYSGRPSEMTATAPAMNEIIRANTMPLAVDRRLNRGVRSSHRGSMMLNDSFTAFSAVVKRVT